MPPSDHVKAYKESDGTLLIDEPIEITVMCRRARSEPDVQKVTLCMAREDVWALLDDLLDEARKDWGEEELRNIRLYGFISTSKKREKRVA